MRYSTLIKQDLLFHTNNPTKDILDTFLLTMSNISLPKSDDKVYLSSLMYEVLMTKKNSVQNIEADILSFIYQVITYYNNFCINEFPKYTTLLVEKLGTLFDEKNKRFISEEMLDFLAKQLPKDAFTNPNYRFLDMDSEIGMVSFYVFTRLMKGLAKVIPNPHDRTVHILNNQLFIINKSPLYSLLLMYLYNPHNMAAIKPNIICGDVLNIKIPKCDFLLMNPPISDGIVIGNSPKQTNLYSKYILKGKESAKLVVSTFTDRFIGRRSEENISDKFYSTDFGLKYEIDIPKNVIKERKKYKISVCVIDEKYKKDYYIKKEKDDKIKVFKSRCLDNSFNFIDKSDLLLGIVNKLYNKTNDNGVLSDRIQSNQPKNIRINGNDKRLSNRGKYRVLVRPKLEKEGKNFIDIDEEMIYPSVTKYKVAMTKNIGDFDRSGLLTKAANFKCFKLNPYEMYSNTYMAYIAETKKEMESIYSYVNLDLIKLIINQLRRSINISKNHFKKIPILDTKTVWTNEKLYTYLKLNKKEIEYIKSKIKY